MTRFPSRTAIKTEMERAGAVAGTGDPEPAVLVGGVLVGGGGFVAHQTVPDAYKRHISVGRRKSAAIHEKKRLGAVWSRADSPNASGLDRVESGEDRRHERRQILHAVGRGADEENAKRQCRDALLELDAAVHCDEDIILIAYSAQQLAVLDPAPAATGNGVHCMTMEFRGKAYGQVLVKQQAHRA